MNKWFGRKYLRLVSSLALSFGVLSPLPASASAVENCVGDNCTITFAFSGQMQTFTPPQNAKNLTFEVSGAQGGKSGGGGGQVTGALTVRPEVLYVFVGGAGGTGTGAPGGFNGGGTAGSGSDMEGSGGGASDIRTGLELSSRIVVAGGGGARGAGLGSGGGSGGGLVALNGRTGQGVGGTGGSQISGGVGGGPNGSGTAGLPGSLGVGGTGGSSSLYGGGGGGGGYFGGGGGGSDTDPCCSDAGGGGGGSSYADGARVANVVHAQGVWPGSGRVVIRYQLAPLVSSISSEVLGSGVSFQIEFDKSVSGFEVSDLEINHSAQPCVDNILSGSGQSYQLLLTDCVDGEVSIAVKPDAVSSSEASGPIEKFTSGTVLIDTVSPTATWGETSSSGALLEFTEQIEDFVLADVEFVSAIETCTLSDLVQQSATTWQVSTAGCELSNFTLSLQAFSVSDASGNLGPSSIQSTSFTADVPEPPAPEPPAEESPAPDQEPEPDSEPVAVEEPSQPVAAEADPEPVREITVTPSEEVVREEPADSSQQIQPPNFFELPPQSEPVVPEQTTASGDGLEGPLSSDQPAESSVTSPGEESSIPGIFTSPPATSLPQASQTVTIPAQSLQPGFGSSGLMFGLLALGLFGLVAGLIVTRRGIPEVI